MRKASSAADGTPRGWVLVAIAQQKAHRGGLVCTGQFNNVSVMRTQSEGALRYQVVGRRFA